MMFRKYLLKMVFIVEHHGYIYILYIFLFYCSHFLNVIVKFKSSMKGGHDTGP